MKVLSSRVINTDRYEVWSEDDARVPDRERVGAAWLRLFGSEIPDRNRAIFHIDSGDTVESWYQDRIVNAFVTIYRIAGSACGSGFISVAVRWRSKPERKFREFDFEAVR